MIRYCKPWLILLPVILFLPACKTGKTEAQNVEAVIFKLIDADNRSDIKTVLSFYTDSIEFYTPVKGFLRGIDNIRASYEKLFSENKLFLKTTINETKVSGDEAFVAGTNTGERTVLADGSIIPVHDNYIAKLVRNKEGEWKINKLSWGFEDVNLK